MSKNKILLIVALVVIVAILAWSWSLLDLSSSFTIILDIVTLVVAMIAAYFGVKSMKE
ncbi:hypothetical protein [Lentilactobacillus kosonis]|uniref:Uncharacterized protein n=1 Tax=Lentilactobacillus kosonis TaxID=2810561 RepID=A0A401FI57_9LACO|nr:hypothetical protein [Lentilactobacillus kosonis]GAY71941.1 hypothetical protein NBRC111893_87 [Lentilactobacillus kosonis]